MPTRGLLGMEEAPRRKERERASRRACPKASGKVKAQAKEKGKGKQKHETVAASTQQVVMVQNTGSGGAAPNGKGTTGGNHGNNGSGKRAPNEKGPEAPLTTMGPGMPEHLTHKDLCPLCEKPIKKGHRFILQCNK